MPPRITLYSRVYGIYPCNGGFAFALLEARGRLIDSGKIDLGTDNDEEFAARLRAEITRCSPSALAIENCTEGKRKEKAQRRVSLAGKLARQLKVRCVPIGREAVRRDLGFLGVATRHEVAVALSRTFPEIAHRLPKRSIWRRDPRLHVFMALALAWTAAFELRAKDS